MTTWEIRTGTAADFDRTIEVMELAYGERVYASAQRELQAVLETGQLFIAHPPGQPEVVVGTFVYLNMRLTFPGGPVDVDGVTYVQVRPEYRRQGVLTAMMQHYFADAAQRGVAWSMLWATQPAIYGRHGFGCAALSARATVGSGELADATKNMRAGFTFHLEKPTIDTLGELQDVWTAQGQHVLGTPQWQSLGFLQAYCAENNPYRSVPSIRVAVLREGGVAQAAALMDRNPKWERDQPAGEVGVGLFVARSAEARLVLAHYLSSLDLATTTVFHRVSVDDSLIWASGSPSGASLAVGDGLWLRPLDVAKALTARTYSAPVDVVLAVNDKPREVTTTVRLLVAEDGTATCAETTAAPDVSCDVAFLGALGLGAFNVGSLRGRALVQEWELTEHTAGALDRLVRSAQADTAPTTTVVF